MMRYGCQAHDKKDKLNKVKIEKMILILFHYKEPPYPPFCCVTERDNGKVSSSSIAFLRHGHAIGAQHH
jgi:hypothetical protein